MGAFFLKKNVFHDLMKRLFLNKKRKTIVADYLKKIKEMKNAIKSFAIRNNQEHIWQNMQNQGQSSCDPNVMNIDAIY